MTGPPGGEISVPTRHLLGRKAEVQIFFLCSVDGSAHSLPDERT